MDEVLEERDWKINVSQRKGGGTKKALQNLSEDEEEGVFTGRPLPFLLRK